MSTTGRKNISFRFSRNQSEDQLQEEEPENDDENLFDASLGTSLQPGMNSSSNRTSSSSGSKWLNDSWKKFQQIVEEKKEKVSHFKKDPRDSTFYRELDYISNHEKDAFNDPQPSPLVNFLDAEDQPSLFTPVDTDFPPGILANDTMNEEPEVFFGEEICEEFEPAVCDLKLIVDSEQRTCSSEKDFLTDPSNKVTMNERPRSLSDRLERLQDRWLDPNGGSNQNSDQSSTPKDESKRFSLFSRFRHDSACEKSNTDCDDPLLTKPSPFLNVETNSSQGSLFKDDQQFDRQSRSSKQDASFVPLSKSRSKERLEQYRDFSGNDNLYDIRTTQPSASTHSNLRRGISEYHEEILPIAQTINSVVNWIRRKFSWYYFLAFVVCAFAFIMFIQVSPFSSFANGFLLGLAAMLFNCGVLIFYLVGKVFQRMDKENATHRRIMSGQKWKNFPAFNVSLAKNGQDPIYEGWFYELVYSKRFGIDRTTNVDMTSSDAKERLNSLDTKARLVYLRLEGNLLRLFIPKGDNFKKPALSDDDKIHFYKNSSKMVQHNYDFSMMKQPRISLWLPKNVKNRKKYLWMMKYPLILSIEETNRLLDSSAKESTKLVLFARTNRDKEEWYARFRSAIENCEPTTSNRQKSSASTPEEHLIKETADSGEKIPRTMSLDMADFSGQDFEHLSTLLSFDPFMKETLNLTQSGSSASNQHSNNSTNGGSSSSPTNGNSNSNIPRPLSTGNSNLLWFNALVARMMFDFLTHSHWTNWVKFKIQRKLCRIRLPYFIQTLYLKDVHLGHSVPKFLTIPSEPVMDEKGLWVDLEMEYHGCFTMTLETKLDLMRLKDCRASERELKPIKMSASQSQLPATPLAGSFDFESNDDFSDPESIVDLSDDDSEESWNIENDSRPPKLMKYLDKIASSKYFQQATDNKFVKRKMQEVSSMPLLLTVTLQELKGTLTINVPRPSTDRIWYGFRENPRIILNAKPCLGERVVSLTHITQWISKKLKQEFNKLLVLPNMDDIPIQPMMPGEIFIDETLP